MRDKNREKSIKQQVKGLGVATLFALTLSFSTLSAQESINTSGGNASSSEGSVSYSVGQVTYQTHSGTNGSVAEGVQQPYEISVVIGIEEALDVNLLVSAYPNPTDENITLTIGEFDISNLSYQLFDANGKLLQSEEISDKQTSIFMSNLLPATYFVIVMQGSKEVKTFKIIKN